MCSVRMIKSDDNAHIQAKKSVILLDLAAVTDLLRILTGEETTGIMGLPILFLDSEAHSDINAPELEKRGIAMCLDRISS